MQGDSQLVSEQLGIELATSRILVNPIYLLSHIPHVIIYNPSSTDSVLH